MERKVVKENECMMCETVYETKAQANRCCDWENIVSTFARRKHRDQKDDIGKSYFDAHILQVVNILKNVTTDQYIISAGYLHDTIEDTQTTHQELKDNFGERIANLVLEMTHDGQKDEVGYYFPRLKSKDAILIKFADRLSNLSRMEAWDKARQDHYLRKSKFWKSEPSENRLSPEALRAFHQRKR